VSSPVFGRQLLAWVLIAACAILIRWKRGAGGVGLVWTYLLIFGLTHWVPAFFHLLPWYEPFYDTKLIKAGFEQTLYGVAAFAVGTMLPMLWRRRKQDQPIAGEETFILVSSSRLSYVYLGVGLLSYFVLFPLAGRVPTLLAIVVNLRSFILAGLTLGCWQAWRAGDRRALVGWLIAAAVWPFVTTVGQGFLGAGLTMFFTVFLFLGQITRKLRQFVLPALLIGYLALSYTVWESLPLPLTVSSYSI
jgi:hypothetical protein